MNENNLSAGDWFFGKVLHMGANWQTTLSGITTAIGFIITMLASLSYELGTMADLFPPKIKGTIAGFGIFITAASHIWNSIQQKSKNVTGGTKQQTANNNLADPGTQTLVDATVMASIQSGEKVTADQRQAVAN